MFWGSKGGLIGAAVCAGGVEGDDGRAVLSESAFFADVRLRLWKKLERCRSTSFAAGCLAEPASNTGRKITSTYPAKLKSTTESLMFLLITISQLG